MSWEQEDEIYQHVADGAERLTATPGVRIADNQNTARIGAPGPTLLKDFALCEKTFHFDHDCNSSHWTEVSQLFLKG